MSRLKISLMLIVDKLTLFKFNIKKALFSLNFSQLVLRKKDYTVNDLWDGTFFPNYESQVKRTDRKLFKDISNSVKILTDSNSSTFSQRATTISPMFHSLTTLYNFLASVLN